MKIKATIAWQHGYVVGQHAMVYRFRIVPIDYKRQGMIAALAP